MNVTVYKAVHNFLPITLRIETPEGVVHFRWYGVIYSANTRDNLPSVRTLLESVMNMGGDIIRGVLSHYASLPAPEQIPSPNPLIRPTQGYLHRPQEWSECVCVWVCVCLCMCV